MKTTRLLLAMVLLGAIAAAAPAAPADSPAQLIPASAAQPAYPDAERKAGVEGAVLLACTIGADGAVTKLVPEQEVAGHPAFTEAAIAAVRQWRFEAAREGGKAVACTVKIPVKFKLDSDGKGKAK